LLLHTYHPEGFDITAEPSDASKSELYTDGCLTEAYDWLFSKINTRQVIWCYPAYYFPYHPHGTTQTRWTLDVPESEAIAFLNRNVWDSIICNGYHVPNATYKRWMKEADAIKGISTREYDAFLDAKEKEFQEKNGPDWNQKVLFRKKLSRNCNIEVLIPSPIKKEWVVDTTTLTFYDSGHCKYGGGCMFRTEDDADKYIEITSSFLRGRKIEFSITKKPITDGWLTGRISVDVKRADAEEL
jgi:hypothetical protein